MTPVDSARVTWREGSRGRQALRFAAVRVRLAHRHAEGAGPEPEVWLLSEAPRDELAPTKYYLSSVADEDLTTYTGLVRQAALVDRTGYQETQSRTRSRLL